jgi:hypothetical protein
MAAEKKSRSRSTPKDPLPAAIEGRFENEIVAPVCGRMLSVAPGDRV